MLHFSAQHIIGSLKDYWEYVLSHVEYMLSRSKQLQSCKTTKEKIKANYILIECQVFPTGS
jgi:hypothetical protein